jgi:hypothetical protein
MKKIITNVFLLICTVGVLLLIPVFMTHDSPIPVEIPSLNAEELAAQKEATAQAEKIAARKARTRRIYSCKIDDDCVIVDKDPCGCSAGPQGVVAINVNYITDFNALNNAKMVAKACPAISSTQKECSPTARGVCKARTCKIVY